MEYYGFDKPVWKRYVLWLGKVVRLDFGDSYSYGEPVNRLIGRCTQLRGRWHKQRSRQ